MKYLRLLIVLCSKKKSKYNIEILENSEIKLIAYKDIENLLSEKPHYEKYFRLLLEQSYIELAERIEDLVFNTAKERYSKLISKKPSLLQRVNLQFIASFLGVTQETLSRIRKGN